MPLTNDLISQFVKVTKDKTADKSETVVYGTVQESKAPNGLNYVKIDGSDLLTPISSTTVVSANDRVTIMIKNHSAVVTGNLTSPSARSKDTISVLALDAQVARINDLEAANATISGKVTANEGEIRNLKSDRVTASEVDAKYATIVDLNAQKGRIDTLESDRITASEVAAKYATIVNLNAQKGRIDTLESTYISSTVVAATYATIENLNAANGRITTLESTKLSAADIEGLYANIDFSNISKATMGQFYANSGLIQNVVVGDSTITGKLVGVTISGDLIEGNTVKAEKLVIKGTDGLYYKLNTDGVTTEAQQTNQNSLDGSVIKAKSVTASKVNVTDLVAFGATIGGFNITDSALYSGVKSAANNTTRGIYLGKDAQSAIGDGTSYIKYYKDSNGNYKLDISADNIHLTSGTNVQTHMNQLSQSVETNSEDLTAYIAATNSKLDDLQGQVDGSIMTWFYEYIPTNNNAPASDWTTTALKNNHLGDLFYDTLTGYCYRWQVQNNTYSWNRITDVDVTKALSDAAKAQDTADKKRRVFTATPTTPYDVGDLWAQGTSGELMRCKTAKTSKQSYAAADWEKASKYTDDTKANAAKSAADAAQADADALKTRMTSAETNITQNSEQIALRATKTEVSNAKSEAISTAATDASSKANAVKSDLNALTTRVTTAESSITQNANAIALCATKDELSALDTRVTSAESSITIMANSIASNVTETTNLGTRTSTLEQTADGLTARIDTAESSITTAQTTANTAKTNAATAQSTANTAKTNAATAQSAADTAKTNAATAQTTANTALARTTVKDTRETNETPGWYMTNHPKQTVVEFKKCTAVGLSGHTYCSLETVVPWNDKSGGYPKQTATVNEKQYWRTGSSDTAWGSWMAASETATNFISFNTTDGVLIGNKTSGTWSGTRAQITGSAFNILDSSGTILSSYGTATTIGKTAENNIYIDSNGVYVKKNGKTLATFDQYGLKIANANDSSGSLGSGSTKPALVIGTPTGYHIEMDNNEIMAKSNATTSSHLFLNMEGGNVSVNNNANRAFMFQEGALYAKNASYNNGEYLGIIDALNDAGNTTLGYGGYLKKIGGTNVYGNSISLISNGNVDVEASWINCRSITPSDNATYALGTYGEKGWSNIYLGKGDGKTNALHIISGSSTYTLCGVNSSGQYIFGNNAAVMYYQVKNVSETATGNAFKVTSGNNTAANNTSSVWFFGAADATSRYIGSYLAYNRTYSSTANMVVTSNGIFGRSTSSSQRYKKDISIADIDDLRGLYDLPVKKFKYKEDYIAADDELYDKPLYGFIVEDLEDVLPCAVQHEKDQDGKTIPEMWNSNIIVPALLKLIQDLNTRLKTLEERENQ